MALLGGTSSQFIRQARQPLHPYNQLLLSGIKRRASISHLYTRYDPGVRRFSLQNDLLLLGLSRTRLSIRVGAGRSDPLIRPASSPSAFLPKLLLFGQLLLEPRPETDISCSLAQLDLEGGADHSVYSTLRSTSGIWRFRYNQPPTVMTMDFRGVFKSNRMFTKGE